jgi:hypothetical protein
MNIRFEGLLFFSFLLLHSLHAQTDSIPKNYIAPAPLFRDPVTDGAADPVLIWNREEKIGGCSILSAVQMLKRLMWLIVMVMI